MMLKIAKRTEEVLKFFPDKWVWIKAGMPDADDGRRKTIIRKL